MVRGRILGQVSNWAAEEVVCRLCWARVGSISWSQNGLGLIIVFGLARWAMVWKVGPALQMGWVKENQMVLYH